MRLFSIPTIVLAILSGQTVLADKPSPKQAFITYSMEILGIPVGWTAVEFIVEESQQYRVDFGLKFEFLFWRGGAAGASSGKIESGEIKPTVCDVTVIPEDGSAVGMWEIFEDRKVTHWSISPRVDKDYIDGCVPVAEIDLEDTLDPLSALIVSAATAEEACDRKLPIFVFGTRFDLTLKPGKPLEDGIYSCMVDYQPISGHRETSESVGILIRLNPELTIFEVAPGLWAPDSATVPTRFGSLVFERI